MNDADGRKLIVAFLARGMAHEVASGLHEKLGLDAFHYGHGRGDSLVHTIATQETPEVDFLSVIVTGAQADEAFNFIFEAGQVDRPGGGLVAQMPLARAAAVGLPAMLPETLSEPS
jgi:hypothetical protein